MARLLLVDDDPLVRETLDIALKRAGHEVSTASNGREALVLLGGDRFDAMIVDIFMAEFDGIETIIEARRRKQSVPMIAISGGGRTTGGDFLAMAQTLGADAILAKPFLPRQLVELVARLTT